MPRPTPLKFLSLEDRVVPAMFTVSNILDTGAGSLRAAITAANVDALADTIMFDATFAATSRNIVLTSGALAITNQVVIMGLATGPLTIR